MSRNNDDAEDFLYINGNKYAEAKAEISTKELKEKLKQLEELLKNVG